MSRLFKILLIACLAVTLCAAEAPRYRSRSGRLQAAKYRSRFLARQEAAEEAGVTPYPSAKELKPDIPFDEAASDLPDEEPAFAPAPRGIDISVVQGGTDDAALPAPAPFPAADEDEEDGANGVEGEHEPDLIYGPPDAEEGVADVPAVAQVEEIETTVAEEEENAADAQEELRNQRLVFGRRIGARKSARPAKLRAASPAKLVKAKSIKARSARLQQLPQQQQLFLQPQFAAQQQQQPVFYYMTQLQQW